MIGNFSTILFFCEITRYNGMTIFQGLRLAFSCLVSKLYIFTNSLHKFHEMVHGVEVV